MWTPTLSTQVLVTVRQYWSNSTKPILVMATTQADASLPCVLISCIMHNLHAFADDVVEPQKIRHHRAFAGGVLKFERFSCSSSTNLHLKSNTKFQNGRAHPLL